MIFIGFTACNNRPIFAAIEQEVELKEFSVGGNVLSLVATDTMVYASNLAGVYSKSKNSDGPWSKILTVERTQKLAKNAANVFASFATEPVKFYDESTKTWADVPHAENIRIIAGDTTVFGYDSNQKKVFKIGTAGINNPIATGEVNFLYAAGNYVVVKSKDSAKLYKADASPAVEISNLPSGVKGMCSTGNPNEVFVLAGSTVYYINGGTWNNKISISKSPESISYFKERKTILLGCDKGYTEIQLDNVHTTDLSRAKQLNPGNSGSTTPPGSYSQYQTTLGSYRTKPVLGVSRGGNEYAIFMGIHPGTITRNTGLWGFYSDKKREWNRE